MEETGFLLFALEGLKVIEATSTGNITLELLEFVEAHACSICSVGGSQKRVRRAGEREEEGKGDILIGIKYFTGLSKEVNFFIRVMFGSFQEVGRWLSKEDVFSSAAGHGEERKEEGRGWWREGKEGSVAGGLRGVRLESRGAAISR